MEVRIHHGTMDPLEIYNWVLLLSLFINTIMKNVYSEMNSISTSITKDEKKLIISKYYESINNSSEGTFDELFDTFIKSSTLKTYYIDKYACDGSGTSTTTTDDPFTEPIIKKANERNERDLIVIERGNHSVERKELLIIRRLFMQINYHCNFITSSKRHQI
jgi:hypothetical protein